MIKYEQDHGEIKELIIEGNVSELIADIAVLVCKVYDIINQENSIMASLFIHMMHKSIDRVAGAGALMEMIRTIMNKDDQEQDKESNEKTMDEIIDDFNKWLKKEVKDNDK